MTTSSTPYGKIEAQMMPLKYYMTIGVSYIASHYSSKPRDLANFIQDAMNHKGFSIVHVQSPCTTYNDTYDLLKGNRRKGIPGMAWDIPEDHDPSEPPISRRSTGPPRYPVGSHLQRANGRRCRIALTKLRTRIQARSPSDLLATYAL